MKIVPFTPPEPAEDLDKESVLIVIGDLIEQAKKGQIKGVAIAILRPDNTVESAWSDVEIGPLLGAIRILEHRFIVNMDNDD